MSLESRILDRLVIGDGCWEYIGWHDKDGYAKIALGPKRAGSTGVHRATYELFREPIGAGLEPDHLCRNRGCVNPWHMELVTTRENVLRSNCPAAINARRTHCVNGHAFTPANTWTNGKRRVCRACGRARYERYKRGGDHSHAVV